MAVETTVVVPSYGNFASLVRCVSSVTQGSTKTAGPVQTVVVTSGYEPEQVAALRSLSCQVLELERPVPTSQSRNLGAAAAAGQFLLFVDDDNVLDIEAIAALANSMRSWADACVVGPAMYYGGFPERLWCAGVRRSRVLMRTTFRQSLPTPLPARMPSEDFPNCFMVRRSEFEAIRGFDASRFPQQWEEGDLARRLSRATGGKAYLVPQARVWHFIEAPLVRRLHLRNSDRAFLVARGRGVFTAVHGDRLQWAAYVIAAQWMFGVFYLGATLRMPRSIRIQLMIGYIRGMRAGLLEGWRIRSRHETVPRPNAARVNT